MTFDPFFSRRDVMTAAAALAAVAPAQRLLAKDQPLPAPERGTAPGVTVKGTVFESRTGAFERQAGDPGLAGVMVSNGREVVRTGADGSYSLPAEDRTAIFVIKPSGYNVPLDETTRLAIYCSSCQCQRSATPSRTPTTTPSELSGKPRQVGHFSTGEGCLIYLSKVLYQGVMPGSHFAVQPDICNGVSAGRRKRKQKFIAQYDYSREISRISDVSNVRSRSKEQGHVAEHARLEGRRIIQK